MGRFGYFSVVMTMVVWAAAAPADEFIETFEHGNNEGGWWYGTSNGYIDSFGGNPGAFFHDWYVDTYAPQPRTSGN